MKQNKKRRTRDKTNLVNDNKGKNKKSIKSLKAVIPAKELYLY